MGLVDKLQELLDEHQLTQKEAAQRLNISPNTLNGYVRGNREPDLNMLTKIADLFEVSADYLLDHHPSHSFCTADYDYYIRLLLKEARVHVGRSVKAPDPAGPSYQRLSDHP